MSVGKHSKCARPISVLIVISLLLSACGAPTAEVIEKVVTKVVQEKETVIQTVIVEGTAQVVEKEVTTVVEVETVVTATPEPTKAVPTEPVYGGIATLARSTLPTTLDVQATTDDAAGNIGMMLLEPLVTFAEDYSIQPGLAESWDISDDGMTYTFHLLQGVTFHDGSAMTSEDVIASMDRGIRVSARASDYDILESYEAIDDYTVVMHLKRPSASFLDALATPMSELSIFPKEIMDKGIEAGQMGPEDLIGTGPYKMAEYIPDQMIRFVPFEDYVGLPGEADGMTRHKTVYFDEVRFVYVMEAGARVAGLLTGEYDWIQNPPPSEMDSFANDPQLKTYIVKPQSGIYILFNHATAPSNNLKFREAILAALDMEALAMAGSGGKTELFDLNECLWPEQAVWHFEDEYSKSRYNQNNPELGKQLLAESGYNGEEIVLVATSTWDLSYKVMLGLSDQLRNKLGMNVKLELYDWPGTVAKWGETENWHISFTTNRTQELINPNAIASTVYSKAGGVVLAHYNNPEMDAAIDELNLAATFEERKDLLKEVQRLFWADLPNIKVAQTYPLEVSRADFMGYKPWYRLVFWGIWRAP